MDLNSLIPIVSAFSTIILVVILAIREYRTGGSNIAKQVIDNYTTLDGQQKANIDECRENLVNATKAMHDMETRFTERIAKLEGVVSEKDKQLENLTRILANRNPDLEETLKDIRHFMKNMNDINAAKLVKSEKKTKKLATA